MQAFSLDREGVARFETFLPQIVLLDIGQEAGFDLHLTKPVSYQNLVKLLAPRQAAGRPVLPCTKRPV